MIASRQHNFLLPDFANCRFKNPPKKLIGRDTIHINHIHPSKKEYDSFHKRGKKKNTRIELARKKKNHLIFNA
ncbi:hypothetical protein HZS_1630 [Henneguya salminicola]|nr:hypothetical protein HZS_1630 [Henneguya salminicola]